MFILFIYFIIIKQIEGYPQAAQYFRDTETGTKLNNSGTAITTIVDTYRNNNFLIPTWIKNFQKAFQNQPKFAFGIQGLQNCAPYYNFVISLVNVVTTLENIQFSGYLHSSYFDINYRIINTYLVVDTSKNGWFVSLTDYSQSLDNTYQRSFVVGTSLSNGAHIYCFFVSMINFVINNEYYVKTTCNIVNNQTVKFKYQTIVPTGSQINIKFFIIIIYPTPKLFVQNGSLLALKDTTTLPLDFIPNSIISSSYFLGLIQFQSINQCFVFSINEQKRNQIDQNNKFKKIQFRYLLFYQPYISFVKSFILANELVFTFTQLNHFNIQTSSTFDINHHLKAINNEKVTVFVDNPITTDLINMNIQMKKNTQTFSLPFSFKIITSNLLSVNTLLGQYNILIINIQKSVSQNNFDFSHNNFVLEEVQIKSDGVDLMIKYDSNLVLNQFSIQYKSTDGYINASIVVPRAKISVFRFSAILQQGVCLIVGIPKTSTSRLFWISNYINDQPFSYINSDTMIETKFEYQGNIVQTFKFKYMHNPDTSDFTINFNLDIVTVKYITTLSKSKISKCKITIINAAIYQNIELSDFSTNLPNAQFISINIINTNVELILLYSINSLDIPFQIIFSPQTLPFKAIITDLKIVQRFKYLTFDNYDHWINFTFTKIQINNILPLISINGIGISIHSKQFIGDTLIVRTQFTQTINLNEIFLNLNSNLNTIYQQCEGFMIQTQQPQIVYCVDRFQILTLQYENMSKAIIGIYWGIFILSMFFCQKIFAVELLFILQFTYMTLIPMKIYCNPFNGLQFLKYSFGWNGILFSLAQQNINIHFSTVGIKSNFISNINFMIIILLLCPVIYATMTKLADYFQHYQTNPRLLTYGKTFLLDIPLTIVFINLPNICLSFIVSLQSFGIKNIISFTMSIIGIIIILFSFIIFIVFRTSFKEFHQQFGKRLQIFKMSIQRSTMIRGLYPIMLIVQITIISTIFGIKQLFDISLFLNFGCLVFFTITGVIICPYDTRLDNIHLFINNFFLLLICGLQILFKSINIEKIPKHYFVYQYPWILLTILILIGVVINLPYFVYKFFLWVKKPNLKDMKLYSEQNPIKQRQYYPNNSQYPVNLYPALEYSINYKRQERDLRNKLLEVPKLSHISGKKQDKSKILWQKSIL